MRAMQSTEINEIASPYLTFELGDLHYALAISEVVEVAAMVEPIPFAAAPHTVIGMANRHGEPILLVDLQTILSIATDRVDTLNGGAVNTTASKTAYSLNTLFIVVQAGKSRLGLLVDSVRQVEYFMPSSCTPIPHQHHNPVQAIISVEDRMIQLIDLTNLLRTVFDEKTANTDLQISQMDYIDRPIDIYDSQERK
jgi:chemotaxis signal transduction protein